jgi:hypothetical protein
MGRQEVERLNGEGTLHAADRLLRRTRYQLTRWAPDAAAGDAPPAIDGHIDITGIAEAVVLAGPDALVLTLEDGRRLAIRLTSTDGAVAGVGWRPAS